MTAGAITEIDLTAPVVVDRDLVVDAPPSRVWRLLTEVPSWPSWQPDITAAAADRPLRTDSVFRWCTAGLTVESTVYTMWEPCRIVWGGTASGITGIHRWTLKPVGSSVHVRTAESWDGDPVRADVAGMGAALGDSLTAWLRHLKKAAEAPG